MVLVKKQYLLVTSIVQEFMFSYKGNAQFLFLKIQAAYEPALLFVE